MSGLIGVLIGWVPELLVIVAGLVLSIVHMKRIRPAGIFALLGFIALLLAFIVGVGQTIFTLNLPRIQSSQHLSFSAASSLIAVFGLVRLPFDLGGWVLILVALFRRRLPVASPPPASGGYPGAPQPAGWHPEGTYGPPPAGFRPPPADPGSLGQVPPSV